MTNPKLASIVLALILSATAVTGAEARTRHHAIESVASTYDKHSISGGYYYGVQSDVKVASRRVHVAQGEVTLLPHPTGCPSRAFCGCGAALEVFGKEVRELWLARNWFKFPRAEPAPGTVAVRRHHVFVIRRVVSPGVVLAYDANSGGHKTRLHLRSLAGYTVVNPRGSKYAGF